MDFYANSDIFKLLDPFSNSLLTDTTFNESQSLEDHSFAQLIDIYESDGSLTSILDILREKNADEGYDTYYWETLQETAKKDKTLELLKKKAKTSPSYLARSFALLTSKYRQYSKQLAKLKNDLEQEISTFVKAVCIGRTIPEKDITLLVCFLFNVKGRGAQITELQAKLESKTIDSIKRILLASTTKGENENELTSENSAISKIARILESNENDKDVLEVINQWVKNNTFTEIGPFPSFHAIQQLSIETSLKPEIVENLIAKSREEIESKALSGEIPPLDWI